MFLISLEEKRLMRIANYAPMWYDVFLNTENGRQLCTYFTYSVWLYIWIFIWKNIFVAQSFFKDIID